jgi:glycogen debranching enzyme
MSAARAGSGGPPTGDTALSKPQARLVEEACRQSIEVLRTNSTRQGIVASSDRLGENYYAVWGRDGSICALAALLAEDEHLQDSAICTLRTLARHQADNGQIPSYLRLDDKQNIVEIVHGGLGNVTTVDSNLWFLIACHTAFTHAQRGEFLEDELFDVYRRTLRHLRSLDSNCCGLLEIPVAGDWSDILDRSYHILYDEVLWCRALQCSASLCAQRGEQSLQQRLERDAERVRSRLNAYFWWNRDQIRPCIQAYLLGNAIPTDRDFLYYQSHLKPFTNYWFERFDALGNVLACLMGVASQDQADRIIERIVDRGLNEPYPIRVLDPPIEPDATDWDELYKEKEPPYSYHNGGAWPLAGSFWVILLAGAGRYQEAWNDIHRLAESLRVAQPGSESWGFHEYFDGKTGQPKGHRWQSWNAAGYLLAHAALVSNRFACFESKFAPSAHHD